ncbi:YheC/YheD family protein [Paenibacillus cremeus]|uniref:YheC/YheD family protein n=1 Tax=Paenibacillus cremeus TaxID=2163881 RepID=A0A559JM99_9BACL|nr:YheC/YheD family protein [Paenibacillus cremeus]TVY01003.1 YheC/YheD family protein [Paenibacillus cremeus]
MSRTVPSKWVKTGALLKHAGVARTIPETRRFSAAALKAMLAKYGSVVAKPCVGAGGIGVMMISRYSKGYAVHYYGRVLRAGSFPALLGVVNRLNRRRRAYLLQHGIRLASIGGRPVDYRVKLVNENGRWLLKAVVARVARPGYFVTNICRGGDLISSNDAIRRSLHVAPRRTKRRLINLSYTCKNILTQAFPGIGQLGFDYGIDARGKIWLFEVNTRPQ